MLAIDPGQSTLIFPIVKMVVTGDDGVGKTSLIRRYCTGTFEELAAAAAGVDFQIKVVEIQGKVVKLSLWDIAGQEQFGTFRDSFYRGARAVALVYDVTHPESVENLARWHAEISRVCPTAHLVVVGNKVDRERQASRERVKEWARSLNDPYLETSAATGQGVDDLFETMARLALGGKRTRP